MEAQLPTKVAEIERHVVMAALRDAVDAVVSLSTSDARDTTENSLNQVVVLKRMVEDINKESDEMLLLLSVVEQRLMEIG